MPASVPASSPASVSGFFPPAPAPAPESAPPNPPFRKDRRYPLARKTSNQPGLKTKPKPAQAAALLPGAPVQVKPPPCRPLTCRPLTCRPPSRAFDLLALDVDGTLLRNDKRLSKANVRAVQRARRAGVRVVLATARPPRSLARVYESLGLNTLSINYNGALIMDPVTGRVVHHQPLRSDAAEGLVKLARKLFPEVLIHLEVQDRWITDRHDERFQTETSKSFTPDIYGPLKPYLKRPVTKLMLMGDPAGIDRVKQGLRPRFCRRVDIHITDHNLLQIVAKGVDKGQALDRVARIYGVPEHRVMAIGDAPNDVGMLRRAGLGLAMGNGWPQTLNAADKIIPTNQEDGVAQAIDQYLLGAT